MSMHIQYDWFTILDIFWDFQVSAAEYWKLSVYNLQI